MKPDAKHRAFQHSGNNRDNTGRDSYRTVRKDKFDEDSPGKETMRRHYGTWGHSRRLYDYKFIKNFLVSSVGKPWNDIYSDVCRMIDIRTPGAREIHEDICRWQVHLNVEEKDGKLYSLKGRRYYDYELSDKDLYVDAEGVLRQYKKQKTKYVPWKPAVKYPITHTSFGDFLQMDGLWYRVKMVEPKFYKQRRELWKGYSKEEEYSIMKDILINGTFHRYYIYENAQCPFSSGGQLKSTLIATYGEPKVCVSKLAANKNEIKKLRKLKDK